MCSAWAIMDSWLMLKLWAQLEYAVACGGEGGCGQHFMYNKEEALVMAETNKYAISFPLWYLKVRTCCLHNHVRVNNISEVVLQLPRGEDREYATVLLQVIEKQIRRHTK
jgi:hypothetical protein